MPVPFGLLALGTILVDIARPTGVQRVVLWARVSCDDRRADLDRQVSRWTGWATADGFRVGQVVAEVGSELNGERPKLARVSDPCASVSVVEHRDRLAGLGVERQPAALVARGPRMRVVDDGEAIDDRVRDMVEVLTGVCARRYGWRGARHRALRAVTAAKVRRGPVGAAG